MSTERITETTSLGPAFDKRRDDIIALAAQLFDRDGYAQTSMNAIADAAGVRKPTLYHYFSSKTEILVNIHVDHTRMLTEQLDRVPRGSSTPQERLKSVVESIVELTVSQPHATRVFFDHSRELPPVEAGEISAARTAYRESVIEIIRDGQADGSIRADVDPYYATMSVFGVTNWLYQWFERDPGSDPDGIAEVFWDFVWRALRSD